MTLLSVFLINKRHILQDSSTLLKNSIILDEPDGSSFEGETYITNCNSHPKKCLNVYCDCSKLCNNINAKKIEIIDEKFESNKFPGFKNGTYCYVPIGKNCKKEFGSWVYVNHQWNCVPRFNGIFTTDGDQLVGNYPFSEHVGKLTPNNIDKKSINYNDPSEYSIDCSTLKDEFGRPLFKVQLDNGLKFCVKDYCISHIEKRDETLLSGYESGKCVCRDENTENLVFNDLTSPCVQKSNQETTKTPGFSHSFKINCFDENTLLKDMDNYLIKCTSEQKSNYLSSKNIFIGVYNL